MGNLMAKWSYSSLSLFKQCPRKYHRLRVVKDIKQEDNTALMYGKEAHKVAEDYVRQDTVIPEKFRYIKAGLLFVVSKDLVKTNYVRNQIDSLADNFKFDVERLDKAYETDVWNPVPNFTCRNYCPVTDCEHNGGYV
jgi:hypothetical protein